uniref:ACB domain-containing protein n=1 Tax=viral metagenome TaxID=1070528 RepID=A0A6C0LHU7_9ZZZZ
MTVTKDENFKLSCDLAHTIPKVPSNYDKLLDLYGLYQTITEGKVNIDKPSIIKVRRYKKFNSWKKWEHLSDNKEEAKDKYIKMVTVWKLQKDQKE